MADARSLLDNAFSSESATGLPSPKIKPGVTPLRVPSSQGIAEEPQTIDDSGVKTTGAGAMLGSALGTALSVVGRGGVARGGAVKEEALAAGGAAIGEASETIINQLLQNRPVSLGLSDVAAMGRVAAESAVGGTVVRGLQVGVRKTLDKIPFFKNSVTAEGRNLIKATDEMAEVIGVSPARPAQITKSGFLDIIDNINSSSLGGASKVNAFQFRQESFIEAGIQGVLKGVSPRTRPDKLGKYIVDVVSHEEKLAEALSGMAFEEVRTLSKNLFASVRNIKNFSSDYMQEVQRQGNLVPRLTGSNIAKKASKLGESQPDLGPSFLNTTGPGSINNVSSIVSAIQGKADSLAVNDLIGFRRSLGKISASYKKNPELENSPAALFISGLIKQTDDSIETALKQPGADPVLSNLYKTAKDGFKKEVVDRFRNKTLTSLLEVAKESPEILGRTMVEIAKSGRGLSMTRIMQNAVVKDSVAWRRMTRSILDTIKMNSTDTATGRLSGKSFLENLIGPNGFGKDGLVTALGRMGASKLIQFTKALVTSQEKNPIGTGSVGIQFTQWGLAVTQVGAILGLSASGREAEAGLVLLGPAVTTRLMHSRRGLEVLTKAIKTSPRSSEWPRVVSRILAIAGTEQALDRADNEISKSKTDTSVIPGGDRILDDIFNGANSEFTN